mmetsp:Transcript_27772/g.68656  ORF Transcript_27772/g.68656 Transcript_27772/m.68656 type:complete len:132 (-) Transcript_27772:484-879(-)
MSLGRGMMGGGPLAARDKSDPARSNPPKSWLACEGVREEVPDISREGPRAAPEGVRACACALDVERRRIPDVVRSADATQCGSDGAGSNPDGPREMPLALREIEALRWRLPVGRSPTESASDMVFDHESCV